MHKITHFPYIFLHYFTALVCRGFLDYTCPLDKGLHTHLWLRSLVLGGCLSGCFWETRFLTRVKGDTLLRSTVVTLYFFLKGFGSPVPQPSNYLLWGLLCLLHSSDSQEFPSPPPDNLTETFLPSLQAIASSHVIFWDYECNSFPSITLLPWRYL